MPHYVPHHPNSSLNLPASSLFSGWLIYSGGAPETHQDGGNEESGKLHGGKV